MGLSDNDYVCSLSPDTAKFAKQDLREDEATRKHGLDAMREWLSKNGDITNCRTGIAHGIKIIFHQQINYLIICRFRFPSAIFADPQVQRASGSGAFGKVPGHQADLSELVPQIGRQRGGLVGDHRRRVSVNCVCIFSSACASRSREFLLLRDRDFHENLN
jgi:hypothetical protein